MKRGEMVCVGLEMVPGGCGGGVGRMGRVRRVRRVRRMRGWGGARVGVGAFANVLAILLQMTGDILAGEPRDIHDVEQGLRDGVL